MDRATLDALASNWLPPLAGVGHQRARALPHGERYIEWIRGAMTAAIFSDPADNLVPHAYALHALETVLSVHLGAIRVKPTPGGASALTGGGSGCRRLAPARVVVAS